MRKINAISKFPDSDLVRAQLDDYGCDGTFRPDGSVVSGTLGTMPQDEMAYRIWAQYQDWKIKEPQLRAMWAKRAK
jgi:hypothetical protein